MEKNKKRIIENLIRLSTEKNCKCVHNIRRTQGSKNARTQCDIRRVQRHSDLCTLLISQAYNYAMPPWLILLFPAGNLFPVWNSHLSIP